MKAKIPKREHTLGVRLKTSERKYIEREASERGQRVSDYVRDVLLATMNFKNSVDKINA